MEKMIWSRPAAAVEQFMPNEYISACWGIECITGNDSGSTGRADEYNPVNLGGYSNTHTENPNGTGCGHIHNQFIQEVNGGYTMVEKNTVTGGDLSCTLFTDDTFRTRIANNRWSSLNANQEVFWTTRVGLITLYHHGYVNFADNTRPLRS